MNTRPAAELIVRAGTVRTMDQDAGPVTALAIRGGQIAAVAGPGEEPGLAAAWQGPDTVVLDDPGLVVMPAFVDTHNHLMLAARNILGARERFRQVPFFWSAHYDVSINYVGHAEKWDRADVSGDAAAHDVAIRFTREGKLLALATLFRDEESLRVEIEMERAVAT